uniref:Prominin 2 n=1 Tax=Amphiprion ocellaris TaxID=80972 RepID=A0A3Q1AWX0_AMPOC
MALCENTRSWRWQGSVAAFRGVVGVMLLLGLSSAQSVPPQAACSGAAMPQSLTQPQYNETVKEDTGVGFMAPVVRSFLHTIQPNPFPADLILKIVQDFDQMQLNQEHIKEALVYQVGFLVCIAIGILYIVLMPIVGFFLACCRCCGNCGGKMYQKQTSAIHCRRRTLYWSAFVTTIIILAGNICMFISNEALKVSVDQSPVELSNTVDNIHTFLTSVPQQVDNVVNESYRTVDEVTRNLQGTTSVPPLTVNTSAQLNNLNSSLVQLQSSLDRIQANVTAVKNHIDQTLSKPECFHCDNLKPELQKLTVDTSISVSTVFLISQVEDYFQSIPQRVTSETKDVVQRSKQQLQDIKMQISQVSSEIPLSDLNDVSASLNQLQTEVDRTMPEVERVEHIRWGVCVALCCVVLLVVVCNLLGLILGPLGLTAKADPTKRSCTADCGGTFLMMGAGLSFFFSWLFMIAVLVLFVLGGNVYTLVCKPWNNGQLLKFLDTPGLIPELDISSTLGLKTKINISDIYRDCEENQPLWTTLHLYEMVDLGDLLNVSKYTEEIQQHFENTNITLSSVTLLSAEVKNKLISISAKAKDFDATAITQQMNNISSINLNSTADKLDELAGRQTNPEIQTELQNGAKDLRQIQPDIETTIIPQLENLNSTIKILQSTAEKINGTVGEVLSSVGAAQDFLNTNTTQIVKTESREFLDCQLEYFIAYADWANVTITQQVGRCGPVAGAVDSAEIILCEYMVESLNAFWFSLGWCMIFFIPSIIFSIKLAKYYRRMKNHIIMNHIPRAQMKFT